MARSRSRKGRLTPRSVEEPTQPEPFDAKDRNAPPPEEADFDTPVERRSSLPPSVEKWRQRSGSGQILTAVALGLQKVFELERDNRPAIVQEAPGDPYSDDDPVVVDFEPEDVDNTTVKVRPWLLDSDGHPFDPDDLRAGNLASMETAESENETKQGTEGSKAPGIIAALNDTDVTDTATDRNEKHSKGTT